jgi:hypothetical protein
VTFKDLQKLVQSHSNIEQNKLLFDRLKDKPFWIWNIGEHKQEDIKTKGDCCFNHIMDLSTKERRKRNQCLIMNCQVTNAILMPQID